jgi:hypothetical protein
MSLRRTPIKKLASRFLLYIAIALGFLALCGLFVAVAVYSGHTGKVPVGWFGLVGFTPIVFWVVVKSLRRYWKRPAFWTAAAGLMVLHLLAFVATLLHYPQWPLLWFIPVSMVEAGLFALILGKLFNHASG